MLIPFKELEELALRAGVKGVKANTFWAVSNTFGLTPLTPSNYFNSFSSEELEELALRAGVKGVKANTFWAVSNTFGLTSLTPSNYFNSFSSEELEKLALRAGVIGVKANTLCLCLIISSQKAIGFNS